MNRELQLQLFQNFIINCTANAKSVKNYSDFKRINECFALLFLGKQDVSILDFDDAIEFDEIVKKLEKRREWLDINAKGKNQYSTTVGWYQRFLNAKNLFSKKGNPISFEKITKNLPLQQIFYGAPGTGKSNTIKREVEDQGRIHFRTTFHPDSDYSTFVGCYKPTMKLVKKTVVIGQDEKEVKPLPTGTDSVEQISYQFVPQAFTKAYCEAWNNYNPEGESKPVFLIIEEINRGNCAQIFGDIFQLLDRGDDGKSEYPIDADEDLKKFLLNATKEDGTPWLVNKDGIENGQLCLPPNLHIWATMNTSDQSLFPIDSAFKRRWDWKYVPIRNCPDKNWKIKIGEKEYDWWTFLQAINKSIFELTKSEDKKLGFFFCKAQNGIISAETFIGKVFFYLWNDVFKDYDYSPAFFRNENGELIEYSEYYNEGGDTPNIERIQDFIEKVEPKFKEILLNER